MKSSDHTENERTAEPSARRPVAAVLASSPAAERNKQPILDVLETSLPRAGLVLEIASGTGQHVVHFAAGLPALEWQPSEADAVLVAALGARLDTEALANVRSPLVLDALRLPWPISSADAIVCINMIHIAPWSAAEGLFRGAGAALSGRGPLVLYGPFKRSGAHTAPSNRAFDASLRARNPAWGIRDIDAVRILAEREGFELERCTAMPANNFALVFRRVAR